MIEVALIGAGDVVSGRHAPVLREHRDRLLVTHVVTSSTDRANRIERILGYGVQRVETIDALPPGSAWQACLVAVPPSRTADVAEIMARKGYAQYIEKPIAIDVVSALKLRDTLGRAGRPAIVGENFRHQDRFQLVRERLFSDVSYLEVRDQLRRGNRTVPRSDDALWDEHIVHISSAARYLVADSLARVERVKRGTRGSVEVLEISAKSSKGIPVSMTLRIVNTWSEDRYSLTLSDSQSVEIKHDYNSQTGRYDDEIEFWDPRSDVVDFTIVPEAPCGIEALWLRLEQLIETGQGPDFKNIDESILDVQFREAVHFSEETMSAVSLPSLPTNLHRPR